MQQVLMSTCLNKRHICCCDFCLKSSCYPVIKECLLIKAEALTILSSSLTCSQTQQLWRLHTQTFGENKTNKTHLHTWFGDSFKQTKTVPLMWKIAHKFNQWWREWAQCLENLEQCSSRSLLSKYDFVHNWRAAVPWWDGVFCVIICYWKNMVMAPLNVLINFAC